MPSELVCLAQFAVHSPYPWCWWDAKGGYWMQCSLSGCPFERVEPELVPVGETAVWDRTTDAPFPVPPSDHAHEWSRWFSAEDHDGCLNAQPYRYRRRCTRCPADQLALTLAAP